MYITDMKDCPRCGRIAGRDAGRCTSDTCPLKPNAQRLKPRDDLLTRLKRVEPDAPGERTRWYRNPDGPEAASEIERLRDENRRLRAVTKALDGLPDGEWEVWTSNSYRRIGKRETGADGDVLHAITQTSDGHPDLSWNARQCQALCDLVNGLRAALRERGSDD